jgi:hypothetical protein
LVQALIVINDATYTPERWQGTLLTWVAVIAVASFNIFCAKHLPLAEGIFCSVHIFAFAEYGSHCPGRTGMLFAHGLLSRNAC